MTTGQSAIKSIFPLWRDRLGLGLDVELVGRDIPLDAPPENYREAVNVIKGDPNNLGGVVTSHKISLFRAAGNLFDELDHWARLCGEISCISKLENRLFGMAKDPDGAGRALTKMLGPGYFGRTQGEVLCFGAGGAGLAITVHLMTCVDSRDRPRRIVMTDIDPSRLSHQHTVHQRLDSDVPVEYTITPDARQNNRLLTRAAPGSLIVNATGMGKDRPGSPLTEEARFPEQSVVWDLNYRGARDFLRQALRQRTERSLTVEDGWYLFLIGWTSHIEEVFGRSISMAELEDLARMAAFAHPPMPAISSSL